MPLEMHETPAVWLNNLFAYGLYVQKSRSKKFSGWKVGANSEFLVRDTNSRKRIKVFTPDGFVADSQNKIAIVFEIANSQTMAAVLRKVIDVWLKASKIYGVIVIKMEEAVQYGLPDDDKIPAEPICSRDDWMAVDWEHSVDITYQDHVWAGVYRARVLICTRSQLDVVGTSNANVSRSLSSLLHLT
jgi:hypothetical protein